MSEGILVGLKTYDEGLGRWIDVVSAPVLDDINAQLLVLKNVVNVKDFNAVGDGVADDTTSIQAALDSLTKGGTLMFPKGTYRTTSALTIKYPNIRMIGIGKRNPQVPLTLFDATVPSTILVDHIGIGVVLSHSYNINGFKCSAITFASKYTTEENRSIRCFGFDLGGSGSFQRDFIFDNITVTRFKTAFEMHASATESGTSASSMGAIRITNCSIMHNLAISKNTYGQWNNFVYENNDSGQNGYLDGQCGIDLKAHGVSICNNILEGTRDPVKVSGGFRGLVIKNNYFEGCVGFACINIVSVLQGFDIGQNVYLNVTATHKVVLYDTGGGRCTDPYWSRLVGKMELPTLQGNSAVEFKLNNSASEEYCRIDDVKKEMMKLPKKAINIYNQTTGTLYNQATKSPIDNYNIPVLRYTTTGTGITSKTYTMTANAGQWIILSWACKRNDYSILNGHIGMLINGAAGNGSQEFPLYQLTKYYSDSDWFIVTCAIKTQVTVTSLVVNLYPYGINPTAGLIADFIFPTVYVVDDINYIAPYYNERNNTHDLFSAAPTLGDWLVGDKVYMKTPTAAGYEAQICTASGTPGTWKGVGLIQA